MPNHSNHSSSQLEPARFNPILPPIQDITLREILDRFSEDPELLKAVLKAKRDELKLRSEEINLQSEKVRLEIKHLDCDGVKDETSPVSQYNYQSPKSTYSYNRAGSSTNLECYISEETSYNGNKGYGQRHLLSHERNESNTLPPLYHNIEVNNHSNVKSNNTIRLKEAPAPPLHQLKRRPSREKVMEALRNKVRHNSYKRTKNGTTGPVLPPIRPSNIPSSDIRTSPSNGHKTHQGPNQTLSALQPRENLPVNSSVGPFSAPVGGPHPEFQFPPPTRLDNTKSKHPTPDS